MRVSLTKQSTMRCWELSTRIGMMSRTISNRSEGKSLCMSLIPCRRAWQGVQSVQISVSCSVMPVDLGHEETVLF